MARYSISFISFFIIYAINYLSHVRVTNIRQLYISKRSSHVLVSIRVCVFVSANLYVCVRVVVLQAGKNKMNANTK